MGISGTSNQCGCCLSIKIIDIMLSNGINFLKNIWLNFLVLFILEIPLQAIAGLLSDGIAVPRIQFQSSFGIRQVFKKIKIVL